MEVEAAGGGDRCVGLVKIDGAAVVGEALLKIEAGVEAGRAAVVEKGVADELLGVETGAEAIVAFFVVELDLWHHVVVGFYAQAVQHVAAAELHENAAIAVVVVEWEQFTHISIDVHAARIHQHGGRQAEVVGDVACAVDKVVEEPSEAHVVREPEVGLQAKAPVALELITRREPYAVEITVALSEVAARKRTTVMHANNWQ